MAEKFSFFNSINRDRAYDADDFAEYFAAYFTNGIFNNGLQILSNSGMTVKMLEGKANNNGRRYKNDSDKIINIANADGILNRIDNIVIRLDLPNRKVTQEVIQGDFAEEATAPELVRNDTIYDLRIAKINIPAGVTEITQDLIEDTRFNANDCGNVICAVQTPNFHNILIQYETIWKALINNKTGEFNTWFENLNTVLDEEAATNLLNLINKNTSLIQTKADTPTYQTITLLANGWVQNGDKYEYTITDTTVTQKHLVICAMDLDNQDKLSGADVRSYDGYYIIRTKELPEQDIIMDVTIQLTQGGDINAG